MWTMARRSSSTSQHCALSTCMLWKTSEKTWIIFCLMQVPLGFFFPSSLSKLSIPQGRGVWVPHTGAGVEMSLLHLLPLPGALCVPFGVLLPPALPGSRKAAALTQEKRFLVPSFQQPQKDGNTEMLGLVRNTWAQMSWNCSKQLWAAQGSFAWEILQQN